MTLEASALSSRFSVPTRSGRPGVRPSQNLCGLGVRQAVEFYALLLARRELPAFGSARDHFSRAAFNLRSVMPRRICLRSRV